MRTLHKGRQQLPHAAKCIVSESRTMLKTYTLLRQPRDSQLPTEVLASFGGCSSRIVSSCSKIVHDGLSKTWSFLQGCSVLVDETKTKPPKLRTATTYARRAPWLCMVSEQRATVLGVDEHREFKKEHLSHCSIDNQNHLNKRFHSIISS